MIDTMRQEQGVGLAAPQVGILKRVVVIEVEENSVEKYSEILADIMKNTVKLEDVNLNININIGKNWAEAK